MSCLFHSFSFQFPLLSSLFLSLQSRLPSLPVCSPGKRDTTHPRKIHRIAALYPPCSRGCVPHTRESIAEPRTFVRFSPAPAPSVHTDGASYPGLNTLLHKFSPSHPQHIDRTCYRMCPSPPLFTSPSALSKRLLIPMSQMKTHNVCTTEHGPTPPAIPFQPLHTTAHRAAPACAGQGTPFSLHSWAKLRILQVTACPPSSFSSPLPCPTRTLAHPA